MFTPVCKSKSSTSNVTAQGSPTRERPLESRRALSHLCSELHLPPYGSTHRALINVALTNPRGTAIPCAQPGPGLARATQAAQWVPMLLGTHSDADHCPPLEAAPSRALVTQTLPSSCPGEGFPPPHLVFTAPERPPAETLVAQSQSTGLEAKGPLTLCVTLGKWPPLVEPCCLFWKMSRNSSCPRRLL